jgi:hypothetical protein
MTVKPLTTLTVACLAVIIACQIFIMANAQIAPSNNTEFNEMLASSMVEPAGAPLEALHMDCEALMFLNGSSAVRHTLTWDQHAKLITCYDIPAGLASLDEADEWLARYGTTGAGK